MDIFGTIGAKMAVELLMLRCAEDILVAQVRRGISKKVEQGGFR